MKKRIVSMILALSMVLSILPVSAFADAGTSAAAAETTAAGTNEETTNPVVTIKIGADGLPEEQSGPGWSYDSSNNWLAIAGVPNAKTEYILDGDASCNVAISTSSNEVYLVSAAQAFFAVFPAFVNILQHIACTVHRFGFDRVFSAM